MTMFIALEGLHGVGKSTVSEILANRIGISLTPTIPERFKEAREFVNEGASIEARYMLFLSAILSTGEQIERRVLSGEIVVVESYIFRTIAFHEGMGSKLSVKIPANLFLPTHTFLLTCNEKIRAERLRLRGGQRNPWDELAEANSLGISAIYNSFGFKKVDTTHMNPEMVADRIMEAIK